MTRFCASGMGMICRVLPRTLQVRVDVGDMGVDLMTIVGHKFGAPKGVAALYVRVGTPLGSFMHGGGQVRNLMRTPKMEGVCTSSSTLQSLRAQAKVAGMWAARRHGVRASGGRPWPSRAYRHKRAGRHGMPHGKDTR